jgi:myo-inositol-1(or 4)-monophosphatase
LLRSAYRRPRQIDYKGEVDLVTSADLAAEKLIVSAVRDVFPDHAILAEEGGGDQSGDHVWLIDPLDGTTNFAHGFPVFCVSIALRGPEGLLVGVVYDPLRDECFTASRGQGAHLNGEPVHVSACPALDKALLATGFPYDRRTVEDNNVHAFSVFIRRCQGIRRAGSAALDLCYVACGRFDGYWEMRLKPWDMSAGALIVREAGGRITDYRGREHGVSDSYNIAASNGPIHPEMLSTLAEIYPQA